MYWKSRRSNTISKPIASIKVSSFPLHSTVKQIDCSNLLPEGLVQVAGIHDLAEAEMLLESGVDLIGIPLRLPVNEEDLSEQEARAICNALPDQCCLITYQDSASEIMQFCEYMGASLIQLHGPVRLETLRELKSASPGLSIVKSLVIGRFPMQELMHQVEEFSPYLSAFITDSYNPETGAEGATGLTHDWDLSRQLKESTEKPLILAGGLNPANVAEAIQAVHPWGVDVHTGVEEENGRKCPRLVADFVKQARHANSRLELE